MDEIRALLRQHQQTVAERYGVAVVGIFGSRARGEAAPDRDPDWV